MILSIMIVRISMLRITTFYTTSLSKNVKNLYLRVAIKLIILITVAVVDKIMQSFSVHYFSAAVNYDRKIFIKLFPLKPQNCNEQLFKNCS